MKTCTGCSLTKDFSEFGTNRRNPDSHMTKCKSCYNSTRTRYEYSCGRCHELVKATKRGTYCVPCSRFVAARVSGDVRLATTKVGVYSNPLVERKCDYCAGVYTSKIPNALYCTQRCAHRAHDQRRRKRAVEYVSALKSQPCSDCHLTYPDVCMDFDHVLPGKAADVSALVARGSTLSRIAKEIALCELVCSNCHRIRTHQRLLSRGIGGIIPPTQPLP